MEIPEKIEMRKIVPVVARISAGKSKLLNVLYNINFLECKAGISTKFINLLRYNPKIEKPRFFHLNIKKEGEKYQLYLDDNYEIIEGEDNIIIENKILNKKYSSQSFRYEDIFYMTEINKSPFIKDENYLLTHDLCDVPGLSEAQKDIEDKNNISTQTRELKEENTIREEIKTSKVISEKEGKKEDEFYYRVKDEKNTYLSEIFNFIKDYIDGGIIILSVENYYFSDNFELITKFHKVINKPISNFLIILNKIDLCLDESKQYIDKCKGLILKFFPNCKTFNLNLNTFIPLSTFRLKEELLLKDNFKYLMKYHCSNYVYRIKKAKKDNDYSKYITFIEYLKEIIKLEEKIEKIDKNKLNALTLKDKNYIKDIVNKILNYYKEENINFGINSDVSNNCQLSDDDIINYLYICHKNKKLIPEPSEETYNLVNYFKINKTILPNEIKSNKNDDNEDAEMILKKTNIKNIYNILSKLKEYKLINDDIYDYINEDYNKLNELIEDNNILIPFLGPKNVGKSTILNCIIGEEIFPLDKPTQKVFIINNSDKDEEINIRKVKLIKKQHTNKKEYYHFDFNDDYIIAKGLNDVKETIKGLNYEFIDKCSEKYLDNPENYFYLIKTKIKLFDNLRGLDKDIKQKIYLFDFPGFSNANEFQNFIKSNILKIFHSFLFVIRESFIEDASYRNILWYIFHKAMEEKGKLYQGFINYCLFILNMDGKEEINKESKLDIYKSNIKYIINPKDTRADFNFCQFKAKSFFTDIKKHNYFYNIKETVNSSFKTYCKIKSFAFKYPEKFNVRELTKKTNLYCKNYDSFQKYLINKVFKDLNETFKKAPKKDQKIEENIKNLINESINDLELPNYNIKYKFSDKDKELLYIYFSFAQSKLSYSSIIENHYYNYLEENILKLINISNNEIHSKFQMKIDDIYKKFNFIFNTDLSKQKEKDYENFKVIMMKLIDSITKFLEEQKEQIELYKTKFITKLNEILQSKKQGIIDETLKGTKANIKNVILKDITRELNKLNNHINCLFNNIIGLGNGHFIDIKNQLSKYLNSEDNIEIEDIHDFKKFFFSIILNKNDIGNNIIEDLTNEIQTYFNNSLSKIFSEKGFLASLKSFFSDTAFFSNFIEIISKYISNRITFILNLLSNNFYNYTMDKIELIRFRIDLLALNYNQTEFKKIKELQEEWNKIKS